MNEQKKLKVISCQIDCKFKTAQQNIDRLMSSFDKYTDKDDIDVIILPEMAFTGYLFENKNDIEPHLEIEGDGPTFYFCQKIAKKLNAYVICGYPQKKEDGYYNSAYVIDRKGEILLNFHKKHLYESDKLWECKEGQEFKTVSITNTKNQEIKCGLAICMDLNPYEFQDMNKYEIADFFKEQQIDAIFFLSAWLDECPGKDDKQSLLSIVDYWIWRLLPLINKTENKYKKFGFYCANRVGVEKKGEKESKYRGTSCALTLNPVVIYSVFEKHCEGFLVADTKI